MKSKKFTLIASDGNYSVYILDMTNVPGWTGQLKQLRIDPENGISSGTFSIDYVKIMSLSELSKGSTATVSSYGYTQYDASKAVDGIGNTYWVANGGTFPQWLIADLGAPRLVSQLYLNFIQAELWN